MILYLKKKINISLVLELNDNQFLAALTKLCERLRVTKQSQDIFQATYSNQLHSSYPFLPCPFKATRKQTLGWFLAAEEFAAGMQT